MYGWILEIIKSRRPNSTKQYGKYNNQNNLKFGLIAGILYKEAFFNLKL